METAFQTSEILFWFNVPWELAWPSWSWTLEGMWQLGGGRVQPSVGTKCEDKLSDMQLLFYQKGQETHKIRDQTSSLTGVGDEEQIMTGP